MYSTGNSSIKISSHDTNSHNLLHQSSKNEGRKEKRQSARFKHETKGAVIYSFLFFFLLRQGREEEDECNCASTSAALGRTDIGIRYSTVFIGGQCFFLLSFFVFHLIYNILVLIFVSGVEIGITSYNITIILLL